jgi:hypothetical protein
MNPALKNTLAVIAGAVSGSIINMSIIQAGASIIPAPDGVDTTTMEGLSAGMHLFEPKHFLFPFLAHAGGTFAGALLCTVIASTRKMQMAMIVSLLFLAGGISSVFMLPSPLWYTITDLCLAYLPMGYFGAKIILNRQKS